MINGIIVNFQNSAVDTGCHAVSIVSYVQFGQGSHMFMTEREDQRAIIFIPSQTRNSPSPSGSAE